MRTGCLLPLAALPTLVRRLPPGTFIQSLLWVNRPVKHSEASLQQGASSTGWRVAKGTPISFLTYTGTTIGSPDWHAKRKWCSFQSITLLLLILLSYSQIPLTHRCTYLNHLRPNSASLTSTQFLSLHQCCLRVSMKILLKYPTKSRCRLFFSWIFIFGHVEDQTVVLHSVLASHIFICHHNDPSVTISNWLQYHTYEYI